MTIEHLQKICHRTAVEHGWWPMKYAFDAAGAEPSHDEDKVDMSQVNIPEKLMLMVSELGEALEHYRNGVGMKEPVYYNPQNSVAEDNTWLTAGQMIPSQFDPFTTKPDGFAVELADCIIRIFDLCGAMDIDIEQALQVKMNYNKTRPFRHGNKKC